MVRLPTRQSFGPRPTPQPSGQVVGIRGGVVEDAQANLDLGTSNAIGQGTQRVTSAIESAIVAQNEIRTRGDAVERARATRSYAESLATEELRIDTEGDVSNPEEGRAFGAFADKTRSDILAAHRGSPESRAQLDIRLQGMQTGAVVSVAGKGALAQRQLIEDAFGEEVNILSAQVAEDPSSLRESLLSLDGVLDDMAPAMSADESRDRRTAGQAMLVENAINTLISQGDVDEAENVLVNTPGMDRLLSPQSRNRIAQGIQRFRSDMEKPERDLQGKIRAMESVLGRPLTVAERKQAIGLPGSQGLTGADLGRQKAAEARAFAEEFNGGPLSDEQARHIAKIGDADLSEGDDPFGSGVVGSVLENMNNQADLFAVGGLSKDDENTFLTSVTHYMQRRPHIDPTTGREVWFRDEAPPAVVAAFAARGKALPGETEPPGAAAPSVAPTEQPQQQSGQPVTGTVATDGQSATLPFPPAPIDVPQVPGLSQSQLSDADRIAQNPTVFDMIAAGDVAGPGPALERGLSRVPGAGFRAEDANRAKARIEVLANTLVTTLQNNPRYAEGERNAIKAEIDIGPQIFDTPQAALDRVIGIDDALAIRERNAIETSQNDSLDVDVTRQAAVIADAIRQFRVSLVPPHFENEDEAVDFAINAPEGTHFLFKGDDGQWQDFFAKGAQ